MATTRIKDLSKTATTVNSDANLVLDGNTGGTQKISRDNFRQDTADAFVAAPGTYNLAPLNSGTGKIDAVYLSSTSDSPKGAWNASTNTPTLADGSGTAGDYYDVTVAGSSDLGSGSIAFTVGDVVKYNGTVWFKIDSVANILDGVSTIDGAKTAIEIPDVGTGPSQVPLNQHLGTMAYQSSDGVSIVNAEVETLEVTDKVTGTLNIATASPEAIADADADDLVIGDGVLTNFGATIATNSSGQAKINFADGAGANAARGQIKYDHQFDKLSVSTAGAERVVVDEYGQVGIGTASPQSKLHVFNSTADNLRLERDATNDWRIQLTGGALAFRDATADVERWRIDSSGNLVANGTAIDFGSTSSGSGNTVTSGLLDDYEEGLHTVTLTPQVSGTITLNSASNTIAYTKVGRMVTLTGQMGVTSVSSPSGDYVELSIPFVIGNYQHDAGSFASQIFLMNAASSIGSYSLIGIENESFLRIYKTTSTGVSGSNAASDFSGNEAIYFSCTYQTNT